MRNRAILHEMTLGMILQIVVFFVQNWCAKKEKFCVSFRKSFANGNPKNNIEETSAVNQEEESEGKYEMY